MKKPSNKDRTSGRKTARWSGRCEVAAQFYAARGFETSANASLQNARNCYDRWGAHGKVKHLDQRYRWLNMRGLPLRDRQGHIMKYVDDRKRAEDALRQAQGDLVHINRVTTMGVGGIPGS